MKSSFLSSKNQHGGHYIFIVSILALIVAGWLGTSNFVRSATDTVAVTASVATSISCSTDATTMAFGALTSGSVSTATPNASTTVSCNVGLGCSLYVRDANAGLATSSPTYTINSSTATLAAGTEGYGVNATTTATGSGGTLGLSATYGPAKWNSNQVGALATSNVALASSTAAVTGREVVVQHRAAISGVTPPASYIDTITYECLGN